MKKNLFLSVITPMYNTENYIIKCLESLNNQTDKDFELIIIDDGSLDNSYKKAEQFLKDTDLTYKIIKQENLGQSIGRNVGIENAKGEYILFLDSDDFIENNLVKKTKEVIKENNLDMLLFDYRRVKSDGTIIQARKQSFNFSKDIKDGLEIFYAYKNNELRIWTSSVIYNRDFLLKNNLRFLEGCYGAEDLNFLFKSLMKAKKVKCIEDNLSFYYQRKDSLTNKPNIHKNITVIDAMEDVCKFIKNESLDSKLEEIIKKEFTPEHIMYQILGALNKNNSQEIKKILVEKRVKKYLKSSKYNTTRYGRNMFIWIKLGAYFPSRFINLFLKRK